MACGFVLIGGAGRAKGFGGPWAPAERRAPAEGEGGGRTTPVWVGCCLLVALLVSLDAGSLGWEVLLSSGAEAVPPSSPDCSLGIWTFRRGRFASDGPLAGPLERGALVVGVLDVRWGDLIVRRAGEGTPFGLLLFPADASFSRCMAAMSIDAERGPPSVFAIGSDRGGSA